MALSANLRKLVTNASNKYSRSSGSRIKPKEGVNRYRILVPSKKDAPWMPDTGQFWADLGVHWLKADPEGKPFVVVGCESTVYQRPSAIATAIDQAIASAIDEDSKKLYESWKTKTSVLVNVLDRSKGSQNPDEPQILELTPTTWGAVMGVIAQFDDEGEDILDPNEGLDITITRTGKGLNTQYAVNTAPGKSAPVPPAALKGTHDLLAHIEKEFFRGDEQKALSFIAQTAGVNLPRLTSARTPTAAIASSAAAVEDAELESEAELEAVVEIEEEVATEVEVEAETPAPKQTKAAVAEDEIDDVLADLENI